MDHDDYLAVDLYVIKYLFVSKAHIIIKNKYFVKKKTHIFYFYCITPFDSAPTCRYKEFIFHLSLSCAYISLLIFK